MRLQVGTWKNGSLHRENVVANMAFPPHYLVAFHSNVMTLYPGDIISTGTPGAVVIEAGDVAECRIEGLGTLSNPVRRAQRRRLFDARLDRRVSAHTRSVARSTRNAQSNILQVPTLEE